MKSALEGGNHTKVYSTRSKIQPFLPLPANRIAYTKYAHFRL